MQNWDDKNLKESTLSEAIDELLGGGISTRSAMEVYGPSGTGKSQFCFQLSVAFSSKGLRVLYFDASSAFRPERIEEIAVERDLPNRLDLIHVSASRTPELVIEALQTLEKRQERVYRLAVIDSIADLFLGIQDQRDLESRSKLSLMVQYLFTFSLRTRIPVVFTNQVRSRITHRESGFAEFGGNVLAQMVHNRILFQRVGQNVFASVNLLTGEKITKQISISACGIR